MITREQARLIAKAHAIKNVEKREYLEDAKTDPEWNAHEWVINAIQEASKTTLEAVVSSAVTIAAEITKTHK